MTAPSTTGLSNTNQDPTSESTLLPNLFGDKYNLWVAERHGHNWLPSIELPSHHSPYLQVSLAFLFYPRQPILWCLHLGDRKAGPHLAPLTQSTLTKPPKVTPIVPTGALYTDQCLHPVRRYVIKDLFLNVQSYLIVLWLSKVFSFDSYCAQYCLFPYCAQDAKPNLSWHQWTKIYNADTAPALSLST